MSIKKKFTISPDLAKGIRNTIQSASSNQGQLHYDMMPLEILEPDPNNPRKLHLTRNEILEGLDDQANHDNAKLKEFESLKELSESIKRIGIKNAIEVYKDGSKYRIIAGERRYWAALLAGQSTIPVRISQKPDEFNLRYTQWVENINRQDLSLLEKYNNLRMIAEAYVTSNQSELTERELQNLLGISQVQAYRYYNLLKADEAIVQLLKIGKLNNLKIVQELVSMKDHGARNQIISWVSSSKEDVTSLAQYRHVAGKRPSASKQKSNGISIGKIPNTEVAKHFLEIILSNVRFEKHKNYFNKVDWTSSKAITKAFRDLFKMMEHEFDMKEPA